MWSLHVFFGYKYGDGRDFPLPRFGRGSYVRRILCASAIWVGYSAHREIAPPNIWETNLKWSLKFRPPPHIFGLQQHFLNPLFPYADARGWYLCGTKISDRLIWSGIFFLKWRSQPWWVIKSVPYNVVLRPTSWSIWLSAQDLSICTKRWVKSLSEISLPGSEHNKSWVGTHTAQGWSNRTLISHERVDSRFLVLPASKFIFTEITQ